jgi:hypothetical protein
MICRSCNQLEKCAELDALTAGGAGIDERNERPSNAVFVAVVAVWATAVLLALALV